MLLFINTVIPLGGMGAQLGVVQGHHPRRENDLSKMTELTDPNESPTHSDEIPAGPPEPVKKKEKKPKQKGPGGRGVQTMFRTCLRNHMNLSAIADNKAGIMLSINAIIISIVLTVLLPRFAPQPYIVAPTVILLAVCLSAVIFAILSMIPDVSSGTGTFTKEDIEKKRADLLFSGNFHKMPVEDFEWGINEVMGDPEFLYGSLARDFYYRGKVLHRKYRYLKICYMVFMYGLIVSVIAFVAAQLSQ